MWTCARRLSRPFGQRADVDVLGLGDGRGRVAQLGRCRHAVDGDVGRAEGGPGVVGVLAELLGEQLRALESLGGLAAVVAPPGDDGGDEGEGAADGEAGGGVVVEVGCGDEGDVLGVVEVVVLEEGAGDLVRGGGAEGRGVGVQGGGGGAVGGQPGQLAVADLRDELGGGDVDAALEFEGAAALVAA